MYQPLSFFQVVVVVAYVVLFLVLIQRWNFFTRSGVSRKWLTVIFLVKCTAALLYGIYHFNIGGSDTFSMFKYGLVYAHYGETHALDFIRLVFSRGEGPLPADLREVILSSAYWGDQGNYTMVRFHALASVISFGYYNVHAIFMAFLSLIGLTGLYRFMAQSGKSLGPGAAVVLALPTVVFYGSGLHKEGLIIACIGLLLWNYGRLLHQRKLLAGVPVVILFFLLYLLKNFYFAALLVGLVAYTWVTFQPRHAILKYVTVIIACWSVAFALKHVTSFNLSEAFAQKQHEFRVLKVGDSDVDVTLLDGSVPSVVRAIPTALLNVFTRPWPSEITEPVHAAYAVEQLFVLLLTLIVFTFPAWKNHRIRNPALLLITFSVTVFIIIGIIVPNLGAISRYKAPALLCFVSGLVLLIDWERMMKALGLGPPNTGDD